MTRNEYLKRAADLYGSGQVDGEVYDAMVMNADIFCDDDEEDEDGYQDGFPSWYAEVEYSDFDNPEAVEGARFDDMNYLRYMER